MTNVAVVSFAGTVGKTTLTKEMVVPLLGNAQRIQIESINSAAEGADVAMHARQFRYLAEKLVVSRDNLVIDIGGSNIESVLAQMAKMEGIEEDIHWWVVPVDERTKVITDTLNTISHLINELNVDPARIVVVANNIEYPKDMHNRLGPVLAAAKKAGFHFHPMGVLKSDLFDEVKDSKKCIIELADDTTDYGPLIAAENDEKKRDELGRKVTVRRMARSLARNIRDVWAATPMGTVVEAA